MLEPTAPIVKVDWEDVPWKRIRPMHPEATMRTVIDQLPLLAWNDMALEGTDLTPNDVAMLVDGAHPVSPNADALDVDKASGLIQGYRALTRLLQAGCFDLEKDTVNQLANHVAKAEVIDPGRFRCDSSVGGGGHVRLSTGKVVSGIDRTIMDEAYRHLIHETLPALDPRQAALYYYATTVRWQLWFDGNKRTARLGMLGYLLTEGYEPLSVPARKRREFHKALDTVFTTGDGTPLCALIASSPVPRARD